MPSFKAVFSTLVLGFILITLAGCGNASKTELPSHNLSPLLQEVIKKAEEGDYNAQYDLGHRFITGAGVPQSHAKARAWYEKAAQGGNVLAQYNLGYMYELGQGTEQNYGLAAKYYQMASYKGHAKAQYSLGSLYTKGQGVTNSNVEAYKWYSISARNGNRKARFQMKAIGKTMSPEDIETAQAIAEQFQG